MNIYQWSQLNQTQQQRILERPVQGQSAQLERQVTAIIEQVREQGDAAVLELTAKYDGVQLAALRYPAASIANRAAELDAATKAAIDTAYTTIKTFHQAQQPESISIETAPGVVCQQKFHPLDAVGLYIPGGTAVLPSTALMLGVPAQIAGCQRKVLVSPPDAEGQLAPAICYVASLCEIDEIYLCGGAQAIAALAYGTESIAPVLKIFGPGNSYVTAAKQFVAQDPAGCAIDMPAGPSELLVIADETARPAYVAADLLSQAEHGTDSQVILVSPSASLVEQVAQQVEQQLAQLPRRDIASQALQASALIVTDDLAQALSISQSYAPEHLSVQLDAAEQVLPQLTTAGSIFVGHYTPESGGDYATGTNHVLPTYGFARNHNSLGLLDFYRRYTVQTASREGLAGLADAIINLAETESLRAHARAVSIRLEDSL